MTRAPTLIVCRGCCCGTVRKHPEVDHDAQVRVLREAAEAAGGKLVMSECLERCEASNVVVVRTHGERLWLGAVLAPSETEQLAAWVRAGAALPVPAPLARKLVEPGITGDAECDGGQETLHSAASLVRP